MFYKKKRLFLSILGIVIGVASLVVMVAVGEGAKKKVMKEFETFSPDTLAVIAGKTKLRGGRPIQVETATTLKVEDAKEIEHLLGVKRVAPIYEGSVIVECDKNTAQVTVVGSVPDIFYHKEIQAFSWQDIYRAGGMAQRQGGGYRIQG